MEKLLERPTSSSRTRLLAMTALFAALGCVATTVIKVPSPTGGYMNLGDTAVLLGAYFLGPAYGALAGGIGPALADLLGGYPMYVPGTLLIKAVMAVTAGLLYRLLRRRGLRLQDPRPGAGHHIGAQPQGQHPQHPRQQEQAQHDPFPVHGIPALTARRRSLPARPRRSPLGYRSPGRWKN